jgi:hypothetical protein
MTRLFTPLILCLALLVGLTGCHSGPELNGLAVELLKLERSPDGSIVATLQIDNSTVIAFNVGRSKHDILLNGRLVGTVEIDEPLGLPAQRNLPQTGKLKLAAGALTPGQASYQLNSALTLILQGDSKEIHKITGTGTVEVP